MGAKFAMTDGLIVRDNTVRANDGAGLWTNIDCVDTLYEGNLVEDNTEYRLENLTVIDDVVRDSGQVGIAQDHDAPEVYERNHRFEGNTYEGDVVWSWADAERSFEEWRGFGNDLTGPYRPD